MENVPSQMTVIGISKPGGPEVLLPETRAVPQPGPDEILKVGQPYANHNGGTIQFGRDGMLYFGLGDGGSGGDPCRSAQDLTVLLGDYIATHRFVTERVPNDVWAAELKRLEAPLGVWAILGNHDWWHGIAGVRRAFADVNIPVLENDAALLGEPSAGERAWLSRKRRAHSCRS